MSFGWESLGDPKIPIQVQLIPQLEIALRSPIEEIGRTANLVLNQFLVREDAYTVVYTLLEGQYPSLSHMIALKILKNYIQTRWLTLNDEEKMNIKGFIMKYVYDHLQNPSYQSLVRTADQIIVEIAKKDWPENWSTFMDDLASSSQESFENAINVFRILQFLGEDVTDFSSDTLQTSRIAELTTSIADNFGIFAQFIEELLSTPPEDEIKTELIAQVLKTLSSLIKIVDRTWVTDSSLFSSLCQILLPNPKLAYDTLILIEKILEDFFYNFDLSPQFLELFVNSLYSLFGDQIDIQNIPEDLIKGFLLTMKVFFERYIANMEISEPNIYNTILQWIWQLTNITKDDEYRTCVDIWIAITQRVATEKVNDPLPVYLQYYEGYFPPLRRIVVQKMECPNEVIISIDNEGIKERNVDYQTYSSVGFAPMRDLMVNLLQDNLKDTLEAIIEKVKEIADCFSIEAVNSLCWAAGCLGCTMADKEENQFVTNIIEYLLELNSTQTEISNRAVIASGIMYVCSQYTTFLMSSYELLKAVMTKLFEFMNFEIPALQDSAINSMRQIVQSCRRPLTQIYGNEKSYVQYMVENYSEIFTPLSPENTILMYEIFALLLNSHPSDQFRNQCMEILTEPLNIVIQQMSDNFTLDIESLTSLLLYINCEWHFCKEINHQCFQAIFSTVFPLLTQIYVNCCNTLVQIGTMETREFQILKAIKVAICRHFECSLDIRISNEYINELLSVINDFVNEYANSNEAHRVPDLISLVRTAFLRSPSESKEMANSLVRVIYDSTIDMIKDTYTDYIQFRICLIQLIMALINNNIAYFEQLDEDSIVNFINFMKFSCENPNQSVSQLSLQTMFFMANNFDQSKTSPQFQQNFQNAFYPDLITFCFVLITDDVHRFVFDEITNLLRKLFASPIVTQKYEEIINNIISLFPNRMPMETVNDVGQIIYNHNTPYAFRNCFRNFLVNVKMYSVIDPVVQMEPAKLDDEVKKKIEEDKLALTPNFPVVDNNTQNAARKQIINDLVSVLNNFSLRQ